MGSGSHLELEFFLCFHVGFHAFSIMLYFYNHSLFECLELKPLPGFMEEFLGYADTEALGDATDTLIGQSEKSENFDINNITYSLYKNHTTGKISVWIFPHGDYFSAAKHTLELYLIVI